MRSLRPFMLLAVAAGVGCGPTAQPPPAPLPGELDILETFPKAEVHRQSGRIDVGTPNAHVHLVSGFGADERWSDGTTFAWGLGEESKLALQAAAPSGLTFVARGWPLWGKGLSPQTVNVLINGRDIGTFEMEKEPSEHRLDLPAEVVRMGWNEIELRYGRAQPPAERGEGSADERALAVAWDEFWLEPEVVTEAPRQTSGDVLLPPGSGVSFYQAIPGGRMTLTGRLEGEAQARLQRTGGLRWDWSIQQTDIRRSFGTGPPGFARVSLAVPADGSPVRIGGLVLGVEEPNSVSFDPKPRRAPSEPARGVVLALVDTLRADRVGALGGPRPITPHLDALARRGWATTMRAQSSWTRTSVASLLTGTNPGQHGVWQRDESLSEQAVTLAELTRGLGCRTGAVVTSPPVAPRFGFEQGFESFDFLESEDAFPYVRATPAVARAREWLDGVRNDPFFLYLHLLDPHTPYDPSPPVLPRLAAAMTQFELTVQQRREIEAHALIHLPKDAPEAMKGQGSTPWIQVLLQGTIPFEIQIRRDLMARYDAEVSTVDRELGKLAATLRALGRAEDTVLVVVSDHGEEFHEHGSWTHGRGLFEEQLQVPLLMAGPTVDQVSKDGTPRQIDILPTVMRMLGASDPPPLPGQSLFEPRGEVVISRALLDLDGRRFRSYQEQSHKIVCAPRDTCQVYDLERDPGERHDLSDERPLLLGYLRARLKAASAIRKTAESVDIDPELDARLRELGYH